VLRRFISQRGILPMKSLLLGSLTLALSAGAAAAQDQSYDWSGAYIGAQAGYGWGDAKATPSGIPGWPATDISPDGIFGGAFAGYNYQVDGGLVLGVDSDFSLASIGSESKWIGFDGLPVKPEQLNFTRIRWTANLRGRMGYAFDRALFFVAGGLAVADVRIDDMATGSRRPSLDKTLTGWTVGAGMDYAFNNSLFGRVEYRYSDFGTVSNSHVYSDWLPYDTDIKTHDLVAGIAYKF
jgi:outer membrane immunogenic protein